MPPSLPIILSYSITWNDPSHILIPLYDIFHLQIFIYPGYAMIFRGIPIYAAKFVFYPRYAIILLGFPHMQHNNRCVPDMKKTGG